MAARAFELRDGCAQNRCYPISAHVLHLLTSKSHQDALRINHDEIRRAPATTAAIAVATPLPLLLLERHNEGEKIVLCYE